MAVSVFRLCKYFNSQIILRCSFSEALQPKLSIDNIEDNMLAWQINSYGDETKLELSENSSIPIINNSNQVLVKVSAASINPLDLEMISGFGSVLLNNMRKITSFCQDNSPGFPLILGRDFSGIVVSKGSDVTNIQVGDKVYGVVKPQNQGCHAQYTVTDDYLVVKKPEFVSMEAASCILYTGITAWSALKISGACNFKNKRVLVIGASGGVGNAAIQLLNAWGAEVIATCSKDAVTLVESLSPSSHIIDYTESDYISKISAAGRYDLILDAAGLGESGLEQYIQYLKSCSSIVTLRSPLLPNIDKYGLIGGTLKSAVDLAVPNLTSGILRNGSLIKWGFFSPLSAAVDEISKLVSNKQITPAVEKVYHFHDVPTAFARMRTGHLRGKIVISTELERHEQK